MLEDGMAKEDDKETSKPKPDGLEIPTGSGGLLIKRKSSASVSGFEKVEQDQELRKMVTTGEKASANKPPAKDGPAMELSKKKDESKANET